MQNIINQQSNQNSAVRQRTNKKEKITCKICFGSSSNISDPLITPCKCSGSMGYIHYQCLKQCIKVRIVRKEADNHICYLWKNYNCEICLNDYPKNLKYRNKIYEIVDLQIPYEKYIVLDYNLYDDAKKKTFRKGIIVVNIPENERISVGRNQNNLIKLKDISVSRSHCDIYKKDNKLYIIDKGSKFGTLLYLNKPFVLTYDTENINNFNKIFNVRKSSLFSSSNMGSVNNKSSYKSNYKENIVKNSAFIDSQINLISGKNNFLIKLEKTWSLFGNLFSNTFCCKYKSSANDDYVCDVESLGNDKEISVNQNEDHLNDSYNDYNIVIENLIKNKTESIKENSD